jgi:FMN reductase
VSGVVTLVGNPRAGSRTLGAAVAATAAVAGRIGLGAAGEVVDLSAPPSSADPALAVVAGADLLVVASPTYKGTYTGLLKSFLDRLPGGALASTVALPVLVMGDPRHALAVEVHFRPLLVELGAAVPTPGLALLESELSDPDVVGRWADRVAPQAVALLGARAGR